MSERWRVGRKVGRTIYQQIGPEPSDDDLLIGVMDDPILAGWVVDAINGKWSSHLLNDRDQLKARIETALALYQAPGPFHQGPGCPCLSCQMARALRGDYVVITEAGRALGPAGHSETGEG